jgi:hypothetical protein
MEYAFLIYSSSKNFHGLNSYEYGFANHTFSIIGDKPFSRGDVVRIHNYGKESRNEFRINVHVIGDPKLCVDEEEAFDTRSRIEIPTLVFLSSRIYLSEYSEYNIIENTNAKVLDFQGVQQDHNKIYAVAALVSSSEAHIVAEEKTSKAKFEWFVLDKDAPRRRGY